MLRTNKVDRLGQRYGRLLVVSEDPIRPPNGQVKWVCQCDCGNIKSVLGDSLRAGNSKSCGCLLLEYSKNELGKKYGKLEVIEKVGRYKEKNNEMHWLAFCECGKEKVVSGKSLRLGITSSCGQCAFPRFIETKGATKHYLYTTWANMMGRCYDPKDKCYKDYAQRGIKVFEEWHSPFSFFSWVDENLGLRPEKYSLDRINVYGHYEPGNLRWANSKEQVDNRRMITLTEEEYQLIMRLRQEKHALSEA